MISVMTQLVERGLYWSTGIVGPLYTIVAARMYLVTMISVMTQLVERGWYWSTGMVNPCILQWK